eukprot:CAMPEP_0206007530 /NCGR_PEP_ID=MMETSP1464-20131121/5816_1 /ASSEMBLY_ACC=CAM_ASM_001124 /TAXON_ID=119497 /ORGANISM="Exanthemachrysis gayraliae, Strain RCC1523" /LENGTH=1054 /DNA_ID=CAMNT_0053381027 /DNA_START=42 /DNA_END=3206 /DNA_ORIENTATION=-
MSHSDLFKKVQESEGDDRKKAAEELATAVQGSGLKGSPLIEELKTAMNANGKKDGPLREAAFAAVAALCKKSTPATEAYLVSLLGEVLNGLSDKLKPVQVEADLAVHAFAEMANGSAIQALVPVCIENIDSTKKWTTVVGALMLLGELADKAPQQMAPCLTDLMPLMSSCLTDLKQQVKDQAKSTMHKLLDTVGNKDIEKVLEDLVVNMMDPTKTEETIHKYAGIVFVQVVTAAALAAVTPLLKRGFQERKDALSRMCAKIVANMSKLVEEPAEALVFMPQIMPLLERASEEVSDPEARGVCEDALEQMNRIKKKGEERPLRKAEPPKVLAHIKAAAPSLDDEVVAGYMNTMCCGLMDSRAFDPDDWEEATVPYLKAAAGMDDSKAKEATQKILDGCKQDSGINDAPVEEEDDAEELCNCKFTLAYGTKILLFNTEMRLKRGFRYGLLGKNDCGKTTLMRSIAEGKVEGFPDPSEVRTVFVEADILGEKSHLTCIEYVLDDPAIKACNISPEQVTAQLNAVGFHDNSAAKPGDAVSTLSGGWRMKLALARAMLQKADILLLDEPTNHLDVMNVKWVQDYLMGLKNVTSIFTSHDSKTLERVATHIMHIQDLKVSIHKGNLTDFVKEYPPAKSYFELKATKFTMAFPQPGYIEGVKSKGKALMKMENCSWTYPKNTKPTVEGITVQVSLSSRVAILGPNGAGKSTMIKLLIGENIPQTGNVWKHPAVRVAYVAQHAFHLIENHLTKSPNEYIRWRYEIPGEDKEAIKKATMSLTEEEEQLMKQEVTLELKDEEGKMYKVKGVVDKLTGLRRTNKQKEYEYQLKWVGKSDDANVYVPLGKLEKLGKLYMKLVKVVDEKIAAMQGMYVRPLTRENVEKQLEDVGLEAEYGTHSRMGALSGGQKVKVVFAAALWNQPHLVLLDEPTNYLDRESLGALAGAIEGFEGGVVIISHNEEFTKKLCKETWLMEKDEETGIAHLNLEGDADWMQQALKQVQEKGPQEQIEEMVDAFGNKTAVVQKKKISKADLKKFKKKIAARRKDGEEVFTDEELESAGWIL